MSRNEELKELMLKVLGRLNAPRAVAGNPEGMKQEAEFLCNSIIKLAPSRDYRDWFADFELEVFNNLETRTWPTAKEISKAAKTISQRRPQFKELVRPLTPEGYKPDPLKINAARIKAGQPVCQSYIVGSQSDLLLRKGLVDEYDLDPYREAMLHRNYD